MNRNAYFEAKQRHPGMVILFRVDDFYELYRADAQAGARNLGLVLTTTTDQVTGENVPMARFPQGALEGYLRQLLKAGHRVAICDQAEEDRPEAPPEFGPTLFDHLP